MADSRTDTRTVREVMSTDIETCPKDASAVDAARIMRDRDIGAVLVTDGEQLVGIATDRDITVRVVADGMDPSSTPIEAATTLSLVTISPDTSIEEAAETMRREAVRRLPVVDGGRPVGIVSLGDLARDDEAADDAGIALSDISEAPPDN
jgi:CBS domain-containing protein